MKVDERPNRRCSGGVSFKKGGLCEGKVRLVGELPKKAVRWDRGKKKEMAIMRNVPPQPSIASIYATSNRNS